MQERTPPPLLTLLLALRCFPMEGAPFKDRVRFLQANAGPPRSASQIHPSSATADSCLELLVVLNKLFQCRNLLPRNHLRMQGHDSPSRNGWSKTQRQSNRHHLHQGPLLSFSS